MSRTVSIKTIAQTSEYDIHIEPGSVSGLGERIKRVRGGKTGHLAIISNRKVFGIYGDGVVESLTSAGFDVSVCMIGDGERHKNVRSLNIALGFLSVNGLSRSDCVVALGGGVVGDLAGFAASVYLRGIEFYQVPTTLLAMIDSSVGGKTAINTEHGKNLVGTFYQPAGVVIDPLVLGTLARREITAGLCEAAKQAALDSRGTLAKLNNFLDTFRVRQFRNYFADANFLNELTDLIGTQVAFKAKVVRGDEREEAGRTDASSRKILNFGHTLAHALEKVTEYRYFKHGEAVGYGILFAAELSKKLELIAADEVELLNDVVHRAGKLPPIANLDPLKVFEAFSYDKKIVDRSLRWILLRGIGKPVIVPQENIPQSVLTSSLETLIKQ